MDNTFATLKSITWIHTIYDLLLIESRTGDAICRDSGMMRPSGYKYIAYMVANGWIYVVGTGHHGASIYCAVAGAELPDVQEQEWAHLEARELKRLKKKAAAIKPFRDPLVSAFFGG